MTLFSRLFPRPRFRDGSRAIDVLLILTAAPMFAPLVCVASILIVCDDGRTPFFVQERVGLGGARLRVFKLRTMNDDGRVTRVGRWLRPTGIDEIPQMLNVLRGDMSLVGPRPLTPSDLERLSAHDPEFVRRLRVRPGITGLVQVLGGRSARHCGKLERLYARRRSVGSDFALLGLSVAINVVGRRRVRSWLGASVTAAHAHPPGEPSPAASVRPTAMPAVVSSATPPGGVAA